jgi:hypothetical protein
MLTYFADPSPSITAVSPVPPLGALRIQRLAPSSLQASQLSRLNSHTTVSSTMSPARLLLVAGLLAISGADAKHKLRINTWDNSQCDGHPSGNKHLSALKEDKCTLLDGNSIMVQMHNKKYSKWINDIEKGPCHVTVYSKPGCLDDAPPTEQKVIPVPADFRKCIDVTAQAASVKFSCKALPEWEHAVFNTTTVVPRTSYSIDYEGYAHAYTTPATLTTSAVSLGEAHMAARAEATANATLAERGDYNIRTWWAKHPFTESEICYKCWTDHKASWNEFKCYSGRGIGYSCGPKPPLTPVTVKSPVHVTTTVTTTLEVMYPYKSTAYIPSTSTAWTTTHITTIVPSTITTWGPGIYRPEVSPTPSIPIGPVVSTIVTSMVVPIPTVTHSPVVQPYLSSVPVRVPSTRCGEIGRLGKPSSTHSVLRHLWLSFTDPTFRYQ